MFVNPLILPIFVSLLYLLVWGAYRYYRHCEHRKIRRDHGDERLQRAQFEAENLDEFGRPKLNSAEILRRADWEVKSGPLMSPLELKNREENRWPIGSAFQAATGIFSGLLVGLLIWGDRTPNGKIERIVTTNIGAHADVPVVVVPADHQFPFLVLTVLAFLAAGLIVLWRSSSPAGKVLGVALLTTAPLISSAKFVLLEKFSPEFKIAWPEKSKPEPGTPPPVISEPSPPFSFTLTLPPFPQGSTNPDVNLRCVLHTFARDLAADAELSSIVVVGRADKRELKPAVRRKYASNWGLAQQRGVCVQQVLTRAGIAANKVLATAAGPLHTGISASQGSLAKDRTVALFVSGSGLKHPWSEGLSQGVELNRCDDSAVLADDICGE